MRKFSRISNLVAGNKGLRTALVVEQTKVERLEIEIERLRNAVTATGLHSVVLAFSQIMPSVSNTSRKILIKNHLHDFRFARRLISVARKRGRLESSVGKLLADPARS